VVGADPAVALPSSLMRGVGECSCRVFRHGSEHGALLPVLGVHGLPGHTERVSDLFPGPTLIPGRFDLPGLDLFRQPAQCSNRPQTDCRVGGPELCRDIITHHTVSLA